MERKILADALAYSRRGWPVFPVHTIKNGHCTCGKPECKDKNNEGKHPIGNLAPDGVKNATTDERQIKKWWKAIPDANIGMATGKPSGVDVLDVDPKHGGDESLKQLEVEYGSLPDTVESITGSGGRHILFQHTPGLKNSKIKDYPGLDVKTTNGYVVAPRSRHISGNTYEWEASSHPDDVLLAPMPQWLIDILPKSEQVARPLPERVPDGERQIDWASLAGSMRRRGANEEEMYAALSAMNSSRGNPPLADSELRSIAHSMMRYPPAPQEDYPLTDFGNAARLVNQHGKDTRYCFRWGKWLVWNSKQWKVDETDEIVRRAKDTARNIYLEAASCGDANKRNEIAKWAKASQFERNLKAMISMAKSEPGIPVEPSQLDSDLWLLNVANGTIDLRTGELRDWQRDDLITKMLPIEYDPSSLCPIWDAFLDRIMAGNQDLIDFLRRAVGYSLTGDTSEQALFIGYGLGANGKTVFIETIKAMLRDYAATADFSTFLIRNSDAPRNDLANLVGTRFVAATETESGKKLSEAVIKQVTGGDEISCRFLYHEPFSYRPRYKLFLTVNHRPIIKDSTLSIWRRIKLIPFAVTIPEVEQDKRLLEKLQGGLSGILAWAVRGCLEWQKNGLGVPEEVIAATNEYREFEDILAGFLGGCCVEDENALTSAKELYNAYTEYCSDNGDEPIKQITFGKSLSERGFIRKRGTKGVHCWRGIQLSEPRPGLMGDPFAGGLASKRDEVTQGDPLFGKVPI